MLDDMINSMTYNINMGVQETEEEFIFSIIQPYIEYKTQMVIGKKFLIDSITKQTPVDAIKGEGCSLDSCPKCHHFITEEFNYCPRCGQKFNRESLSDR